MLSTLDPLESEGGSTAEQLQALGNVCADTVPRALDISAGKIYGSVKKVQRIWSSTDILFTPYRKHLYI